MLVVINVIKFQLKEELNHKETLTPGAFSTT